MHSSLRLHRETAFKHPKELRARQFFALLTWKYTSHHNGVHFFDSSIPKSAPKPRYFMCFWLGNILRATTACTFSISQLPEVVRTWGILCIIAKIASRHNDVHFFDISASKSAPRLKYFVHFDFEIYFMPQRHTIFHLSSSQIAPHTPL